MEHSVTEYLKRQSTDDLLAFVKRYLHEDIPEDFSQAMPLILKELANRYDTPYNKDN